MAGNQRVVERFQIHDASAADGFGTAVDVQQFKNVYVSISAKELTGIEGDVNFTIKIAGSCQDTAPDFDSAVSASNQWFYVDAFNVDTAAQVTGATGVALSVDPTIVEYKVFHSGLKWVNVEIDSFVEGELYAWATVGNNS